MRNSNLGKSISIKKNELNECRFWKWKSILRIQIRKIRFEDLAFEKKISLGSHVVVVLIRLCCLSFLFVAFLSFLPFYLFICYCFLALLCGLLFVLLTFTFVYILHQSTVSSSNW